MTLRRRLVVLAGLAGAAIFLPVPAASAHAEPPPLAIQIDSLARSVSATGYVITVRNHAEVPQQVVVTQRFAQEPAAATASDAGQVQTERIVWTVDLAPLQERAVSSEIAFPGAHSALTTVCLSDAASARVLECTAADLTAEAARAVAGFDWTPWIVAGVFALAAATAIHFAVRFRSRWLPQVKDYIRSHSSAMAVVTSALVVVGLSAAALLVLATRAGNLVTHQEATRPRLAFGVAASSGSTDFTLYHWGCTQQESRVCTATVAIQNRSASLQQWFARMQRLQHAPGSWSEPDIAATTAANGGADMFAAPLAVGERRIAVLVFTTPLDKPLRQLQLREGAFTDGVALLLER